MVIHNVEMDRHLRQPRRALAVSSPGGQNRPTRVREQSKLFHPLLLEIMFTGRQNGSGAIKSQSSSTFYVAAVAANATSHF